MRKIVDTILPTTMVGSYPRPGWFQYQLGGRDARVAFKHVAHEEAFNDATPQEVADRIRKVIAVVPPERVYLTTDCGMKPLTRMVAAMKLKALAEGAALVRAELGERR